MYLERGARALRRRLVTLAVLVGVLAASYRRAGAAPLELAERARAIVGEVEADPAGRELAGPAAQNSRAAAAQAEAAAPAAAALLAATALEWAEVARDLLRAVTAERVSDGLEQDASGLDSEIARLRAAVEQTLARVGRARQDVQRLEQAGASARPAAAPH
jgi:hypothetical protein